MKAAHWGNLPGNREVRMHQKEKREIYAEIWQMSNVRKREKERKKRELWVYKIFSLCF